MNDQKSRAIIVTCVALMLSVSVPTYGQTHIGASVDALPALSNSTRPFVSAARTDMRIDIDGVLDEAAWQRATVIDDFKQSEPVEGAQPTERTEVRIVYDDEAIFIGARMYDSSPDSIVARLGRRDSDLDSDLFGFFVDPFLDRRTGYYFGVNAAGTLLDGVLMNDDWDDDTWDGVWQCKVRRDDEGWTAEMRIPYSQIRFNRQEQYTWGINFRRDISRKNEQQYLIYTPRSESGFVSRFADLKGIEQISPPRQIEVVPYITTRADYSDVADGDPFNDGSDYKPDVGADLKVGVTNNLTMNATVNPDFGQVEVDPAVVNLGDIETFFDEKRPFFVEGSSNFSFGRGGSNNNWSFNWGNPNFFYSRRIGRAPQGSMPDHDFVDRPDGSRILGAAKLTGKLGGAWNVGTVQAVTDRAKAQLALGDEKFTAEVEPLSYYGIVRAQREFQEGYRALGFISTTTVRELRDARLRDELNSEAFAFGLDGWTFLDRDRMWVVTGWMGATHVRGTEKRILSLQQNSQHYFQRPDAKYVSVDSSATSLTGMSGRVMLNKQSGRLTSNSAIGVISPGFDVNDVGFQWQTDLINVHSAVTYRWTEPKSIYRRIFLSGAAFRSWDFDGHTTWTGLFANSSVTFKNYYNVRLMTAVNPKTTSTRRTRGGPLMVNPWGWQLNGGASTDSRKQFVLEFDSFMYRTESGDEYNLGTSVEWKPADNVSFSVGPELSLGENEAQWVTAVDDETAVATFGRRYVFAHLDQKTLAANLRLNWTFTPQLSFQLFAQPLISSGDYSSFKELKRPKSFDLLVYGQEGSTFDPSTFIADPDGSGIAPPIQLENPDFNYKSLRGTAVMRWEYRPGSTLFLVWTQSRDDFEETGAFDFRPSLNRLFNAKPDNIFMIKFTYWLSR